MIRAKINPADRKNTSKGILIEPPLFLRTDNNTIGLGDCQ